MAITTRRGRPAAAQATQTRRQSVVPSPPAPPAATASAVEPTAAEYCEENDNDETQEVKQREDEEMRAVDTISASSSTSANSSGVTQTQTQTPPASNSTSSGSTDVLPAVVVGDTSGGDGSVRRPGTNKRLRVMAHATAADLGGLTHFGIQNEEKTVKRDDVRMHGDDGHSGSNGGDTTSVQTGEWTEDTDMQQEILVRIADLSSKNQQLSDDIEMLKRNFTLRQAETNQLLVGMGTLNKVESDLGMLQREYRDCARNNVALIQDALRRISYCSSQVDTLTSGGNLTATQLQNFRHECNREMDDLLLKLEDVESGQQQQQDQVDLNNLSTLEEVRRNQYEIEQLKHEINSCKRFMTGGSSGSQLGVVDSGADALSATAALAAGTDGELLARIEKFTTQLEDLHNEMAMLKQFLLQESSASRSGIEKLLSRQLNDFQELQDDESKRLQEEMDELRSELCDVLKEMHLLKERTRYLRPDCSVKPQKRPRDETAKSCRQLQQHTINMHSSASGGNPEMCSTCSNFQGGNGGGGCGYSSIPSMHCSRSHCEPLHHCRYHYPIAADTSGRMDRTEYAYPASLNMSAVSANLRSPSPSSSRSSSPRRPSDVAIQALQQYGSDAAAVPENQSCPSPHFSSRSSSISGRISVNRGENSEPLPEEEVERRLLEQHRLFWIKEGAGETKGLKVQDPFP